MNKDLAEKYCEQYDIKKGIKDKIKNSPPNQDRKINGRNALEKIKKSSLNVDYPLHIKGLITKRLKRGEEFIGVYPSNLKDLVFDKFASIYDTINAIGFHQNGNEAETYSCWAVFGRNQ